MEIAEDEINRAKKTASSDTVRDRVHNAFRFLCPTDPLRNLHPDVYSR